MDIFTPGPDGHLVSEKQRRVAEILHDYDDTLELHYIPPGQRRENEKNNFAVVHRPRDGKPYYLLFAEEADERLLARVFGADNAKGDVQKLMDAHNAALEALKLKEQMEAMQEDHDVAYHVLRSPKHSYKHNGIDFGKVAGGRLD